MSIITRNNQRPDASGKPLVPKRTVLSKTPLVLIIDISKSMEDVRIEVNKATASLLEQVKSNVTLHGTIDILVLFFNGETSTIVEFKPLEDVKASDLVVTECKGCTYMGQAILAGIDMAYKHRQKLIQESDGVATPNQPWVFLMTDGQPDAGIGATDKEKEEVRLAFEEACNLIKSKEKDNKIAFIAAGIEHDNSNVSVADELLKLKQLLDMGVLSQEEFDEQKNKLLSK